jgi:GNAT superfamily N-acetyltransferase
VCREIGYFLFNDAKSTWYVATSNGAVVGFATVSSQGAVCQIHAMYTLAEFRNTGVMTAILKDILSHIKAQTVRITCNKNSESLCVKAGFRVVRRTVNFAMMEKDRA